VRRVVDQHAAPIARERFDLFASDGCVGRWLAELTQNALEVGLEPPATRVARLIGHQNLVAKASQRAGLQPHRFERYLQSDDPDFEPKAADVIGLYINSRDHAAVFAVAEKTTISARQGTTGCQRDP
jgi:hypothetical protein